MIILHYLCKKCHRKLLAKAGLKRGDGHTTLAHTASVPEQAGQGFGRVGTRTRPQRLCHGSRSRPQPHVDDVTVGLLAPQTSLPAKNSLDLIGRGNVEPSAAMWGRRICCRRQQINRVVLLPVGVVLIRGQIQAQCGYDTKSHCCNGCRIRPSPFGRQPIINNDILLQPFKGWCGCCCC